jgi:hypothetical protein
MKATVPRRELAVMGREQVGSVAESSKEHQAFGPTGDGRGKFALHDDSGGEAAALIWPMSSARLPARTSVHD